MTISLIDTHTHIHSEKFDPDRAEVIAHAQAADVHRMINIGYDLPSSKASIALAEAHPEVWATVGIQPHYALETSDEHLAELRKLATHSRVVAIGECGMDYYHDRAPHELQEQLFRQQIALAQELSLPLVIHSRDAHEDTLRILSDAARDYPVVLHSFSGDWAYAQRCLAIGCYLSFSGPLTFKKALDLHEVAEKAPLDRMLIETDAPYLTPHPFRGKRNEPARVRLVAEKIAELRALSLAEIALATTANAERVFPRLLGV